MNFADWLARVRASFPLLTIANSRPTSPVDAGYNCIAWAAEDAEHWWWPDPLEQNYWPKQVPRIASVESFVGAYSSLGYSTVSNELVEPGKRKIAIFAKSDGIPTHASRQLDTGWWTSKLGQGIDIEHELRAIEGPVYGKVVIVLSGATPG